MNEVVAHFVITYRFVGVYLGAMLHFAQQSCLQGLALQVWDHLGSNGAKITIQHSHHHGLADRSTSSITFVRNETFTAIFVHVLKPSANEGFIDFDRTRTTADLGFASELLRVERQT